MNSVQTCVGHTVAFGCMEGCDGSYDGIQLFFMVFIRMFLSFLYFNGFKVISSQKYIRNLWTRCPFQLGNLWRYVT